PRLIVSHARPEPSGRRDGGIQQCPGPNEGRRSTLTVQRRAGLYPCRIRRVQHRRVAKHTVVSTAGAVIYHLPQSLVESPVGHEAGLRPSKRPVHVRLDLGLGSSTMPDPHLVNLTRKRTASALTAPDSNLTNSSLVRHAGI